MNCEDCQNQFSDFIDAEISLNLAASLEKHLATCPSCTTEWQHFQETIHTLHSFPSQKVPADFIIGMNEKLAQQPVSILQGWFSFMTQHKLPATTALATLMVAVISTAFIQLSPLGNEQIQASKQSGETLSMLAMTVDTNQNDYYPDTPYLAPKSQLSPLTTPQTRVQFTPVKQSAPRTNHNSILDYRGPPTMPYSSLPHPSLSRLETTSPDLVVTVHSSSKSYKHALIRQLTTNRNWKTQISNKTLLITLPASQLATFQHLFGPADPHINPLELSRLTMNSSNLLTVAVDFH